MSRRDEFTVDFNICLLNLRSDFIEMTVGGLQRLKTCTTLNKKIELKAYHDVMLLFRDIVT